MKRRKYQDIRLKIWYQVKNSNAKYEVSEFRKESNVLCLTSNIYL